MCLNPVPASPIAAQRCAQVKHCRQPTTSGNHELDYFIVANGKESAENHGMLICEQPQLQEDLEHYDDDRGKSHANHSAVEMGFAQVKCLVELEEHKLKIPDLCGHDELSEQIRQQVVRFLCGGTLADRHGGTAQVTGDVVAQIVTVLDNRLAASHLRDDQTLANIERQLSELIGKVDGLNSPGEREIPLRAVGLEAMNASAQRIVQDTNSDGSSGGVGDGINRRSKRPRKNINYGEESGGDGGAQQIDADGATIVNNKRFRWSELIEVLLDGELTRATPDQLIAQVRRGENGQNLGPADVLSQLNRFAKEGGVLCDALEKKLNYQTVNRRMVQLDDRE